MKIYFGDMFSYVGAWDNIFWMAEDKKTLKS